MNESELVTIEAKEITPTQIIDFARTAARALKEIVTSTKTSVVINHNEYLKFEAWQTIAKFYNTTVTIEWTRALHSHEGVIGYEARANVIDKTGRVIGSAESSCSRDEDNWRNREDFQIRSMAQTRSCAKALRQVFAWVVVLSGYNGTPAEEMEGIEPMTPKHIKVLPDRLKCFECDIDIKQGVYQFSMDKYKMALCYNCQDKLKKNPNNLKILQKKDVIAVEEVIIEETKNGN